MTAEATSRTETTPCSTTRRAPAWTTHTPDELTFSHQPAPDLYAFTAPSASTPGKINRVDYSPTDRTAHCDCFAGEVGKYECWHAHHAEGAWLLHICRQVAQGLTMAQLVAAGRLAAARVDSASWFWPAYSPIDVPMLRACRDEWRARFGRRGHLRVVPPASAVAEPEPDPEPTPPTAAAGAPPPELAPSGRTREEIQERGKQALAALYGGPDAA